MASTYTSGWHAFLAIILICTFGLRSAPALADEETESLKGLGEFRVEVTIDERLKDSGMDPRTVRTSVEIRLREAGIVVLADTASRYAPHLWLMANVVPSTDKSSYGGSVDLSVRQAVFTARRGILAEDGKLDWAKTSLFTAETWSSGFSIIWGLSRVQDKSREVVSMLLDDFINAYLTANPKPADGR